ncbi:accessory Sec system translocase SecA2 [Salsuginibacillus kocurii]|uniref:accessory Sec system translocase SecA2 n=1 Tax=Salsuginibacillus kocurii TaxID=427078 RepID=UPI000363A585|nr:accessory Sec system translocase SecA2 [Salsuginibacillus kocurii]
MIGALKKIIGDPQEKQLKQYYKLVETMNAYEPEMESLSDGELQAKTADFKERLADGASLDDVKVEAFAVVREASRRVIGMRHFDVQLIGGLALFDGDISEMATGEGKTLVASLASYVHALTEKGVHVITVNEYLARRDRDLIGQVHEFLGLTVGLNVPQIPISEKQKAYKSDITYGIGSEFGFDFLRDHMAYNPKDRVQRPLNYAIVDEIDSVLVDEAKTPLIIAGKSQVNPNLYHICAKMARSFKADSDYTYDPITKSTNLTDEGISKIERAFGVDNLYDLEHQTLYHFMLQALRAHVMFTRDVEYIVKEGEIQLVDMFTGRIMEGRTFSEGLHQALEAKEGLKITEENKTQATITIQNYFRMYDRLSGMTGTAKTEEKEFQMLYGMDVLQVPQNKERIREDKEDLVFASADAKYQAVAEEVEKRYKKGQPVLVGTSSIVQSETMAGYLDSKKVPYELLNAKSVEREVQLISLAGQRGQVTIATNMAGRGTDIMLGEGVKELGGLCVIGTEKHESRRIDNQLRGRSGRQGDPGDTQFMVSLEDDMLLRFGHEEIEKFMPKMKTDKQGVISNNEIDEVVEKIQIASESQNYAAREYTLKMDDVVNEQRQVIYDLRKKVLESEDVFAETALPMVKRSVDYVIKQFCPDHEVPEEWQTDELLQHLPQLIIKEVEALPKDVESRKDIEKHLQPLVDEYVGQLEELKSNTSFHEKARKLILTTIDMEWIAHIEAMSRLKEGIGLRGYEEDPMRVYTREGYELFTMMYSTLEYNASMRLSKIAKPLIYRKERK